MVRSRPKLGLSRKIVAYYLLFSLIAVCWLAAWVVVTSHALLVDRTANSCLLRLGKASAAVEMHLLHRGPQGVDQLLDAFANLCLASHCAIVGRDGKFIAHTRRELVGAQANEPEGDREFWGEVTSLSYRTPQDRALLEYRTPLGTADRRVGELRVAVEEPSLWATIGGIAHLAPLGALIPLGLVVMGAGVISRLTRPVAAVEMRLREIAHLTLGAEVDMEPLPARDTVTLGWNRVVDHLATAGRQSSRGELVETISNALEARSNAQFEEVLQRLSDGVAVTDAVGRITFANQAISALLGVDDELDAIVGASIEDQLSAKALVPLDTELLLVNAKQRTATSEIVQKSNGCERVLRVARLPLGNDHGRSHVWSLRDITQQKLTEQTRDRFIDTATHELRTPLANIKAYAETLATTEYIDIELQKEFCNIINSEVTRLARFIDDLLSISSMEVGALAIDRQKVETQRMFAEVLSKVEPLMQKKTIAFETSLPPKMPELNLDKDKIIAVLVNILGNAAKYTPDGGTVALKVVVEKGTLRVSVKDNGVGVAAEELPRLFDKFFRSEDPRVQAETGSGLGLSLAQEVVRMHGGEIAVESVLNEGSVFTVILPLS